MRLYADTSFLISLYGADEHSPAARDIVRELGMRLLLTELQRFEFDNALRLLRFRKLYSARQGKAMADALQADEAAGFLAPVMVDWSEAFRRARGCSERHTGAGGHRAMDILHVAAALSLEAGIFLSFDTRQRELARVEGLDIR